MLEGEMLGYEVFGEVVGDQVDCVKYFIAVLILRSPSTFLFIRNIFRNRGVRDIRLQAFVQSPRWQVTVFVAKFCFSTQGTTLLSE